METKSTYDIILAGGGAAGLSLLFHLLQSDYKDRNILLIDRENKETNDRTWCFWETQPGMFESIVYQRWQQMYFHSPEFYQLLNLHPYSYKMIRGIDFYRHVYKEINSFSNVTIRNEEIKEISEQETYGEVVTDCGTYRGNLIFSSLRKGDEEKRANGYQYLLQHFQGWVIQTARPFFNPQEATLMDFRIEQQGDCRFMYVLPIDEHNALVEYTIFSKQLLSADVYGHELLDYLTKFLHLKRDEYQITHEEFGVIPMTDMQYPRRSSKRIIQIGTAGGATKASSGYTFQRIQRDSQQIVQQLMKKKDFSILDSNASRFQLFDSVLLNVMGRDLYPARNVFSDLFKNNPTERVLRFLDEDTHFMEDLAIMNSVPKWPFLKGTWYSLKSKF